MPKSIGLVEMTRTIFAVVERNFHVDVSFCDDDIGTTMSETNPDPCSFLLSINQCVSEGNVDIVAMKDMTEGIVNTYQGEGSKIPQILTIILKGLSQLEN